MGKKLGTFLFVTGGYFKGELVDSLPAVFPQASADSPRSRHARPEIKHPGQPQQSLPKPLLARPRTKGVRGQRAAISFQRIEIPAFDCGIHAQILGKGSAVGADSCEIMSSTWAKSSSAAAFAAWASSQLMRPRPA